MSLRQAAAALRLAVPRIAAQAARSEATTATTTTARTLKTSAAPRRAEGYHYVSFGSSCFDRGARAFPVLSRARAAALPSSFRAPTIAQRAARPRASDPRCLVAQR